MSIIDAIIGILVPHNCLGCNREGELLCALCTRQLASLPECCYRCQTASADCMTCAACRPRSGLYSVRAATAYGGNAKALIWKLKLSGAQAAAKLMARRLISHVEDGEQAVIVPVPTASSRIRQRGYDQAKLLARELAGQKHLQYADWLARSGQTHQHGLSRNERLTQLRAAFRVVRPREVRGVRIILVDDVVTTGATLEAAAAVLRSAGAKEVKAVVFARA